MESPKPEQLFGGLENARDSFDNVINFLLDTAIVSLVPDTLFISKELIPTTISEKEFRTVLNHLEAKGLLVIASAPQLGETFNSTYVIEKVHHQQLKEFQRQFADRQMTHHDQHIGPISLYYFPNKSGYVAGREAFTFRKGSMKCELFEALLEQSPKPLARAEALAILSIPLGDNEANKLADNIGALRDHLHVSESELTLNTDPALNAIWVNRPEQ